ncbi:VTC domain protein [compost metagenome]
MSKEAIQLSREEYDQILKGDISFLLGQDHQLIKDFYRALSGGYQPAAIVDYVREAYVYELGDVRITFDKMLSAGVNSHDLFDPNLVLTEALDSTRTILEIKYNDFLPEAIRLLVRPDSHNRSSISKYVICRELGYRHFRP